jgi:mannosyltransferase
MLRRPVVWLMILAGLFLRLAFLGASELWYDEAFTRLLVRLPFERMIMATAGDTHPPLFYLVMWGWVRLFGESEFSLRFPAMLASVAAWPVFWLATGSLGWPRRVRQLGLTMLTLSPFQVYFAQEARMYAGLQLVVLLAVWCLAERRWLWLALSITALLYLHNYGVIYAAILGLWALYRERRLSWHLVAAFALPALAFVPWALVLLGQMQTVSSGYWIEPVRAGDLVYTLNIVLFGAFTRQLSVASVLVAVGWLTWSLLEILRERPRSTWAGPALWLAIAPVGLAVAISLVWRPVYLFRGLIGCAPFVYGLVAWPLARLELRWQRLYTAALIVPMLIAGQLGYWLDIHDFKSTTLDVLERVRSAWQPGDIVYSVNDGTWVTWSAYWDGPVYLMPECPGQHDRGALSPLTRQALGVPIAELADVDHKRAWVLWNYGAPAVQCNVDKGAAIVGDRPAWYMVMDNEFVTSGIWLLTK